MEKQFTKNLKNMGVKRDDKIILAVSGGVDSAVMLDLFSRCEFINIVVAHLNHGVRKEAGRDQKFVEGLAKKYNLNFETKKIIPPTTGNLEEELRIERRRFLIEVAKRYEAKYIALAHNKNDQAETLILNLLRGSGLSGLAAMKSKEGKVIRPLLSISREEILEYAKNKKLAWMEDITNFDLSFNRNYIRHKVLPTFFDINTEYLNNIYRTTRIISEVDEHLKQEAKKYADADVSELQKLEKPVLYEVFALKYEAVKGDRKDLTYRNIDDLTNLISKTAGCKSVDLPADVVAKRNYQKLEIKRKKEDNGYSIVSKSKLKIGKNYFNDWIFDIAITNNFVPSALKDTLFIDSDRLPDLHIRPPKAGDKIKKEGITGRTKLQDIFTNAKISKDKRTNWPIIVNQNDEILWIPKVTYSRESYPKTKKIIKITLQEGSK